MMSTISSRMPVASSESCEHLVHTTEPFILVLRKDENLFDGILNCAKKLKLSSASITGLGAIETATIAFYDLAQKKYDTKAFSEGYELISLHGNITFVDNEHFLHIHGVLSGRDFHAFGGHFMEATVGPTVEITIVPLSSAIHREFSAEIGLKLICPMSSSKR